MTSPDFFCEKQEMIGPSSLFLEAPNLKRKLVEELKLLEKMQLETAPLAE